jgi:hypothetical protein
MQGQIRHHPRPGGVMRDSQVGANMAVFVLFFGLSLLQALQTRSWLGVAFWLAIGALFLVAGRRARRR